MPARSSSARDDKRQQGHVRLNKFLADNGVASRRGSDVLIEKGKVTIDGEIVTELGIKIDPATQTIEIDGVILRSDPQERRYYVLNKPAGVVCTNEIRETRRRAIDLITDPKKGRIFSVGRLDEESKGLLLLTSDGEFADRIAHPRYGVSKTYQVRVPGKISDEAVQKIREGVHLAEGRTGGARVLIKRRTPSSSMLEVTIQEGKNREIRRIFARVGYKVSALTRTQLGPLSVRGLREGKWRALSRAEVEALIGTRDENEALADSASELDIEPRRPATRRRSPARRPRASGTRSTGSPGGSKAGSRTGSRRRGAGGRRRR